MNFEFLKDFEMSFYDVINTIRENCYLKPEEAGRNCRKLLEMIIKAVYEKENKKPKKNLAEDIAYAEEHFKTFRNAYRIIGKREYLYYDKEGKVQTEKNDNGIVFIRYLGNRCSHFEDVSKNVVISKDAIVLALEVFHSFFTNYYKVKEEFNILDIPIGNYKVNSINTPADSERSQCLKEYRCTIKLSKNTNHVHYALVREYDPNKVDNLFLNRNLDAYSEISNYIFPNGLTVKHLNQDNQPFANYYIVYEFANNYTYLQGFLKNHDGKKGRALSLEEKLTLCKDIGEFIYQFHSIPIYHRMLSYESIVIMEWRDRFIPYVVKFDFCKISAIEGTVYYNLNNAMDREKARQARYHIAEEINENAMWDKVDIYSLGVLFIDILLGKITTKSITQETFEELEEIGVEDSLLTLLDAMLSDNPLKRPDIKQVMYGISNQT